MRGFEKVLSVCLKLDAEENFKLGYYNRGAFKIVLYNIVNTPASIQRVRQALNTTNVRYTLLVESPKEERSNVYLLDIDI